MSLRILASLAFVFVATTAHADGADDYERRMAILPIVQKGPHGSISHSAIFRAISSATERRIKLRVISYEEMFVASQEGLVERVRDCGPDPSCIASRLRRFNARYGAVVVLNFELDPPLSSIQILDTDAGKQLGERLRELTEPNVAAQVARLEEEADALLTEVGFPQSGRLVVNVTPPNATVVLEDGTAPDPGSGNLFTVPAGAYRVLASAPGWEPAGSDAAVSSGATTELAMRLSEQTSWWKSPWIWIAAGVVAAAGTTAVVATVTRPDPCLCVQIGGEGCSCR